MHGHRRNHQGDRHEHGGRDAAGEPEAASAALAAGVRALRPGLRVSLPSLRIDSAAVQLARFGGSQRGSATLAPEAATQELRDRINKGIDEGEILDAVRAVFSGGFTGLKLYFMIGLPGETDDDAVAIARLAGAAASLAKEIGRGRARLSLAVSSYVPATFPRCRIRITFNSVCFCYILIRFNTGSCCCRLF